MTDLGTLGGTFSTALVVNNGTPAAPAVAAGNAYTSGDATIRAVSWNTATRAITDLGALGGDPVTNSIASAINNNGQVVGASSTGSTNLLTDAVLYSNGTITDLGSLGGSDSEAEAVNDSGVVVGYATTPGDAAQVASLYRTGRCTT